MKTTQERGRTEAVMTVEAAFIVPLTICLFVMLISFAFLEYDKTAALQECCVRVLRESIRRGSSAPAPLPENGWVSYFGLDSLSFKTERGRRAEVSAEGSVHTAIPFEVWMTNGNPFAFTVTVKAGLTDPPQSFRRYRRTAAVLRAAVENIHGKEQQE